MSIFQFSEFRTNATSSGGPSLVTPSQSGIFPHCPTTLSFPLSTNHNVFSSVFTQMLNGGLNLYLCCPAPTLYSLLRQDSFKVALRVIG